MNNHTRRRPLLTRLTGGAYVLCTLSEYSIHSSYCDGCEHLLRFCWSISLKKGKAERAHLRSFSNCLITFILEPLSYQLDGFIWSLLNGYEWEVFVFITQTIYIVEYWQSETCSHIYCQYMIVSTHCCHIYSRQTCKCFCFSPRTYNQPYYQVLLKATTFPQ